MSVFSASFSSAACAPIDLVQIRNRINASTAAALFDYRPGDGFGSGLMDEDDVDDDDDDDDDNEL